MLNSKKLCFYLFQSICEWNKQIKKFHIENQVNSIIFKRLKFHKNIVVLDNI